MSTTPPITITPVFVADLLAEGERMPVYVHVIDHPDGRVLVDTGMTELHPAAADREPRIRPLSEQDFDLSGMDFVVNTRLHFDHCGGNRLFAGTPAARACARPRAGLARPLARTVATQRDVKDPGPINDGAASSPGIA